MRKIKLITMAVFTLSISSVFAQESLKQQDTLKQEFEVKVITSVESIIPDGLGRSRLISTNDKGTIKNSHLLKQKMIILEISLKEKILELRIMKKQNY